MIKKVVLVALVLLLSFSFGCWGAPASDNQQVGQNLQEMRKNLAWLTLGLSNLSQSNDSKLKLTTAQKKKILPVFEGLVSNNLIRLTLPPQTQHNNQSEQSRPQYNPNDPQVQARIRKMKDQTELGNKQADLIDSILTDGQRNYIDNLNFDADKYGFLDFHSLLGNGGQQQQPDQKTIDAMRAKIKAGQAALVKLNNEVLQMLKS